MNKFIFAQGGLQFEYPENTVAAYKQAIQQNFGIIIDIRVLKDGNYICFKNRYMKQSLSFPGKINKKTYEFIKTLKIKGTKYRVPLLKNVLRKLDKNSKIIIKLNGEFNKSQILELIRVCNNKQQDLIFATSNLITYFKFKLFTDKKIILLGIRNDTSEHFEILRSKDYKHLSFIPGFDDIVAIAGDKAENVVKNIYLTFNKNNTRVDQNHFVLATNIAHRAISSTNVKEHSKEGLLDCIKKGFTAEIDVVLYNGELRCYHSDNISSKLGQESSIAEKTRIEDSLTFEEVLKIVDGKTSIIIDIKDFSLINRKLEKMLVELLKDYKGEFAIQCWNPLVVRWFQKKYPEIIRGQVGNSLSSLKKTRSTILLIVNFLLFYKGDPDYIVYDLDKYVMLLSRFNNILGIPVIGYTAFSKEDIDKYKDSCFDNIIIEGDFTS